jgi:hypothetical protein
MSNPPDLEPIRLIVDNAVEAPALVEEPPAAGGPDRQGPPADNAPVLPEGCPIVALGIRGEMHYYLDERGQIRAVEPKGHSRLAIQSMMGRKSDLVFRYWPRKDKNGRTVGWHPEDAAQALMAATARKGIWNVMERVRGAGAWAGPKNELILHCGDRVFWSKPGGLYAEGEWRDAGLIGGHVYPASAPLPRPRLEAAGGGDHGPAAELLTVLKTWSWRRGEIDALLLLGWIAAAMMGGALNWRPVCWITGGRGTGKSTLHELIEDLMGGALIRVSDASAAGVWQKLGHATLPVELDEVEAEEDNRRSQAVVKLARQAASGGMVLRGGADHSATEFIARSAFLFSSILIPPLLGQDRSRVALLELLDLKPGTNAPKRDNEERGKLGEALLRRLVDGWPRFQEILEAYRIALMEVGHGARGADQFGTLLAAADILLHDGEFNADYASQWLEKLRASEMAVNEDDARDEERCLQHLLTSVVDPYRSGARSTLGQWVQIAAGKAEGDQHEANKVLATYGLKVLDAKGQSWLAVANYHQGLANQFFNTHWSSRSGAAGVWAQALRRLPGAERGEMVFWFGGRSGRATMLPVALAIASGAVEPLFEGSHA